MFSQLKKTDVYRYISLSAIEANAKPIVLVKGRSVGVTTIPAIVRECYLSACGLLIDLLDFEK